MLTRSKSVFVSTLLAVVWIAALSVGLGALSKYENAPGSIGATPSAWPEGSRIKPTTNGQTLIMVAHPRCPCSRASVAELAKIMAHIRGKVRAYVLFWTPQDGGADWEDTDLRRSAAQIPGVTVSSDVDGIEAQRFGAETSGHTFLFGSDGRLLFSGGITESRGHAGDNAGESAIVSLVNKQTAKQRSTSVFGCALVDRAKQDTKTACPN